MEMVEYQELSRRTMDKNLCFEKALINYGFGLVGESGECLDTLKKCIFHGHTLTHEKLQEELGDVLFYISALASSTGISLEDIAWGNVAKLKKRYPNGFNKELSQNRID